MKKLVPSGKIRSALRRIWWQQDVSRRTCLFQAKVGKKYRCNICNKLFVKSNVQVDHIVPCGSTTDWNLFIENLFCPLSNLQCLCKECHNAKGSK